MPYIRVALLSFFKKWQQMPKLETAEKDEIFLLQFGEFLFAAEVGNPRNFPLSVSWIRQIQRSKWPEPN